MKKLKITGMILLGLVTTVATAQHHDHTGEKMEERTPDQQMMSGVDEEFKEQLTDLYGKTLSLNDAFVQSDAKKVVQETNQVEKALQAVNMNLLKGDAHMKWMNEMKILKNSLGKIKNAETLEDQRNHFADFNEALYRSIKFFGLSGEDVYYKYCPMALENQGAYWLGNTEEIRNPYFGEKMLTCGSVREVLEF